jgi:hypothetical protein
MKSPELVTQIYSLDNNLQYRRENNRAEGEEGRGRRRRKRRGRMIHLQCYNITPDMDQFPQAIFPSAMLFLVP